MVYLVCEKRNGYVVSFLSEAYHYYITFIDTSVLWQKTGESVSDRTGESPPFTLPSLCLHGV